MSTILRTVTDGEIVDSLSSWSEQVSLPCRQMYCSLENVDLVLAGLVQVNARLTFANPLFVIVATPRKIARFAQLGPPSPEKNGITAKKLSQETRTSNGMLPVMRPDAAGIDIGETEI